MMNNEANGVSFLEFIDPKTIFGFRDLAWCIERINGIAGETLSDQLLITEEGDLNAGKKIIDPDTFRKKIFEFKRIDYGNKSLSPDAAILRIECSPQPIYHKNFELVIDSFTSFLKEGYTLYILSDSEKQIQRIQSIFEDKGENISFTPVQKTLHEGFINRELRACFFTDHQFFDRFHKYSLKSDKARSGKLALSLKELQQIEIGDYIVHIDHGVGKFGGLIRTEINGKMQEVIKLIYQNDDILFVSIHALHKVAK